MLGFQVKYKNVYKKLLSWDFILFLLPHYCCTGMFRPESHLHTRIENSRIHLRQQVDFSFTTFTLGYAKQLNTWAVKLRSAEEAGKQYSVHSFKLQQ